MGTQPKSVAHEAYRRQIAKYVEDVQLATGWKNTETGRRAGDLAHTTIGRAKKGEHTLAFEALLVLEQQSGVPIPDALIAAARSARQSTRPEEADLQRRISEVASGLSEAEQQALLAQLQRSLAKAS